MAQPMKQDVFEQFATTMEGILIELTNIRVVMERQVQQKKEIVKKEASRVASFDDFLTYYQLVPEVSFDGKTFREMYDLYEKFCPLGKYEPITENRFSRLVHKLGYRTKGKKVAGLIVRVFERSNNI